MESTLTIGKLARAANVPVSTVRYYERSGLLRPESRSDGNYRLYGDEALERLRFIRAAQGAGFTLDDIMTLLRLRDGEVSPCDEVRGLIEDRLTDLEERLRDLQHVQGALKGFRDLCLNSGDQCRVIEELDAVSSVR